MALKLSLKDNERLIAGGAVIRNTTGKSVNLVIENEVPLLREKDIIGESKANTPCKRVYLVIQLMYVDGQNLTKYQKMFWELVREVVDAAPSTAGYFKSITEAVYNTRYYQALKETKKLIQYEERLTNHAIKSGASGSL